VNLQLDHFPMIKKQNKTQPVCAVVLALLLQHNKPQQTQIAAREFAEARHSSLPL
jgi:hypothetical protein